MFFLSAEEFARSNPNTGTMADFERLQRTCMVSSSFGADNQSVYLQNTNRTCSAATCRETGWRSRQRRTLREQPRGHHGTIHWRHLA